MIFLDDSEPLLRKARLDSFHACYTLSGTLVDRNRFRHVVQLSPLANGFSPFIKRFQARRGRWSGQWLAQDEAKRIRRFHDLGFPGPKTAAMGWQTLEENKSIAGFLLFLAPPDVTPLDKFLRQSGPLERRTALENVALWLGRIHEKRVRLPDLSARHIMVERSGNIYFIDLARLRFGSSSQSKALTDLARLSATLELSALSTVERLRYLYGYGKARSWGDIRKARIHTLWKRVVQHEIRQRKTRKFPARRVLTEVRSARGRLYLDRGFVKELDDLGLSRIDDFLQPGDPALLLRDLGIRKNYRIEAQGKVFYLKVHAEKNRRQKESAGRREWNNHLRLFRMGLPCPLPVAWGESDTGSFFMSQSLEGETLEALAPRWRNQPLTLQRRWVRDLALKVGRLHRAGFYHRDLYLSHVIVRGAGIAFIDLQRLEDNPVFAYHRRIKDLAALYFSSREGTFSGPDRLRFFLAYSGGGSLRGKQKKMIRTILKKALRIARHQTKKTGRS